jgi:hypothetical protein
MFFLGYAISRIVNLHLRVSNHTLLFPLPSFVPDMFPDEVVRGIVFSNHIVHLVLLFLRHLRILMVRPYPLLVLIANIGMLICSHSFKAAHTSVCFCF